MRRSGLLIGGVTVAAGILLALTSDRYGYHRDELYFLACAQHPALGYPDQPPLTPLLAWLGNRVAPGSVWALRIPATCVSMSTVPLIAATAREMGASGRGQLIAAATAAASAPVLVAGHTVSTTTFEFGFVALVSWLVARLIRTDNPKLLLAIGAVTGVGLWNKFLLALPVGALLFGFLIAGPRRSLPARWLLPAIGIAFGLAAPVLIWQAQHGFPQFAMAQAIAAKHRVGGRWGLVPYQILVVSPFLTPVWLSGLVRLFGGRSGREFRGFAVGYFVMLVLLFVGDGHGVYMLDGYPGIIGAGGIAVDRWVGSAHRRGTLVAAAIVLSAAVYAVVGLPIVPVGQLSHSPTLLVFDEPGEQIGWPQLASSVSRAYQSIPAEARAHLVVLTANYGEAGALQRYGPGLRLPPVYSGHNGFADWGPPPDSARAVLLVGGGPRPPEWTRACGSLRQLGTVDNGYHIDNSEQGTPIRLCDHLTQPWSQLWPQLRRLD